MPDQVRHDGKGLSSRSDLIRDLAQKSRPSLFVPNHGPVLRAVPRSDAVRSDSSFLVQDRGKPGGAGSVSGMTGRDYHPIPRTVIP